MTTKRDNSHFMILDKSYSGQYVATKSFNDKEVIASGESPETVLQKARDIGITTPVVFFVPKHDTINVYRCQ